MPMGVASMSLTCRMPAASMPRTCGGRGFPAAAAARAGTRLSRISVVLPEPETPVTTESRPFGNETQSGCTVWIASVVIRMQPSANSETVPWEREVSAAEIFCWEREASGAEILCWEGKSSAAVIFCWEGKSSGAVTFCWERGLSFFRAAWAAARNGPILEFGFAITAGTVPCAMRRPPAAPAAGPSSMSQSACPRTCTS